MRWRRPVRLSQASQMALSPRIAALATTYTTPADTVARETCNAERNMLVVGPSRPRSFQWLIRRLRLAHAQPVPLSDGPRRDRRNSLWRDLRAGEFCKSEVAGNDRHNSGGPVPQEVEDRFVGKQALGMPMRSSKTSDARLTGLFLDMLAAEQGAGQNTLDAY